MDERKKLGGARVIVGNKDAYTNDLETKPRSNDYMELYYYSRRCTFIAAAVAYAGSEWGFSIYMLSR